MSTGLSPTGIARATETARRVLGSSPGRSGVSRRNYGAEGERFQGKLLEDLDAGSLEAPTTAQFQIWIPDPESSDDPVPFIESEEDPVTIVNRDESLEGTEGAFCKVELINGELSPYWVGCP